MADNIIIKNDDDKVKDAYVDAKKDVKNAWEDTKAAANKAANSVEAEAEKI